MAQGDGLSLRAQDLLVLKSLIGEIRKSSSHYSLDGFEDWCVNNLWIVDKEAKLMPFRLRAIQQAYLEAKARAAAAGKPKRFLLLKYRQGGFTTLEQALSYHLATKKPNAAVLTLADTQRKTSDIFKIVHRFYQNDPSQPKRKGQGNAYRMEFEELDSRFICGTAMANSEARGGTYQRVHGSEVAFWCQGGDQIAKQREVMAGLEEASARGELVLETTPNGLELFCDLYQRAKRGENDYTPIFLPWFSDIANRETVGRDESAHIMANLTEKEDELVRLHRLDAGQIKWRRRTERRLGVLMRQEHPEDDISCFMTSGQCRFNQQVVVETLESIADYLDPEKPATGVDVRWIDRRVHEVVWEKPEEGVEYVAGMDVSEGVEGGDSSGVGILRRDNCRQVAAIHGLAAPQDMAKLAVDLCRRYNNAVLAVERENHGHAALLKCVELKYRKYLYCEKPNRVGWSTNAVTRPVMIDDLAELLDDPDVAREWVRDRLFLQECLTFVRQGHKFEASAGAHDDCLMKWAIAVQARKRSRPRPGIIVLPSLKW